MSSTELSVREAADSAAAMESMIAEIRNGIAVIDSMNAEQAQNALIWAEAVAAAANMRRAWDIAREACEMKIRAERRIGMLLAKQIGRPIPDWTAGEQIPQEDQLTLNPRRQGAYVSLGKVPQPIFDVVVADLLKRHKSVDVFTVLRAAHRESLETVEPGIYVAWDGAYFLSGLSGIRRASSNDLGRVREELSYLTGHPSTGSAGERPAKIVELDAAYSKARRDSQALATLSASFFGDVRDLISEAELLQMKVAELLFNAYRIVGSGNGKQKAIR